MPNVTNPNILKLAGRVRLEEDPAMTACVPDRRPARVTIKLKSGKILQATTETNRGDWSDPYSIEEIRDKYMLLTTCRWHEDKAARVWEMVRGLDHAESLDALFSTMAKAQLTG